MMHNPRQHHQQQRQQQQQFFEGIGSCRGSPAVMNPKRGLEQMGGRRKQRAPSQPQVTPVCQVEGCSRDLRDSKGYHRRHRVCELHSKTPKNVVDGIEQRFCQQCSRFHTLDEFDDGKRSCRKRLAGHNERRRKPPAGSAEAIFTSGVFNPGDFKQQPLPPHPHLLDGSFLSSWPESSQQAVLERARPQIYALPVSDHHQHQQQQEQQDRMLYEFLKSHAMAAAAALSSSSASCSASDPPPQDQRGALSLLSAGQSSTAAAGSADRATLISPPSSSARPLLSPVFEIGRVNHSIDNSNNNHWMMYANNGGRQATTMMGQIPQPMPTTTSALEMLQNLPFLRG